MVKKQVLIGELLDDASLTLEELAKACAIEPKWILEHVEAGVLSGTLQEKHTWRFISADLVRARRLISIERDFDANPELAALVADLIEEVNQLRQHLNTADLVKTK